MQKNKRLYLHVVCTSLICIVFGFNSVSAEVLNLNLAIQNAQSACSGISDAMSDLKKMAGINTAVTAVGTVAGGVALGTGIAKKNVDQEQQELKEKVARLVAAKKDVPIEQLTIADEKTFIQQIQGTIRGLSDETNQDIVRIEELERKSKTLGHIRTGTLATNTATNVAGTLIASTNKVDGDLKSKISNCISAVQDLTNAKLAAKVEGTATETDLTRVDKIVAHCRDWEVVDLESINKRATGAAISSGVGIGTGVVGTITSAVANTDATRKGDEQKEKNLNTTANVMAGVSTVASATATVFNAIQISAIKKAAIVADECEGALR